MTTYATEIRDAALTLLAARAVQADKPFRKTRSNWGWPLADTDLPALSVFLPRETMSPDGDANAAEPKFINDMTLGVVISVGFDTPEALDEDTVGRADTALEALLTTPSFLKLFESIERVDQKTVFDKDGQTFLVEIQFDITIRFRTDWPPVVPDDFLSMSIAARPIGKPVSTSPTIIRINEEQSL